MIAWRLLLRHACMAVTRIACTVLDINEPAACQRQDAMPDYTKTPTTNVLGDGNAVWSPAITCKDHLRLAPLALIPPALALAPREQEVRLF